MSWRLLSLLFLGLAAPAAARPNVPPSDVAHLEKGANLEYSERVTGSAVMVGKAIGVIKDTPEAVVQVLLDVAKYRSFMPRVTDSRVVKTRGLHTFAVFETDLPWPVKDAWVYIKFTRYNKPGRIYEIKWWMLNGTMKNYTGSALVEPWTKDATQTVLTYELLAEPKTSAPDSMISQGVKKIANIFVQKIRLRLMALRKYGKMPK